MLRFLLILTVLVLQVHSLWPIPRKLHSGNEPLILSKFFSIELGISSYTHYGLLWPDDLKQAIEQTETQLKNDKLARLVIGRGVHDLIRLTNAPRLKKLKVSLELSPALTINGMQAENMRIATTRSIAEETALPVEQRREDYILHIPSDGSDATLVSSSCLGLFRGLTTFSQIWYSSEGKTYTLEAPFSIEDEPYYVRFISCSIGSTHKLLSRSGEDFY